MQWHAAKGQLSWWNKEKQVEVVVKLPFTFMVLDELSTITGYSKPDKSGFWSNEVKNITRDELTVRLKSGIRYAGLYKNEQGIVQMPKGARYTKSVYIAHLGGDGEYILGNLKFSGSALTAWIEFSNTIKVEHGTVVLKEAKTVEGELDEYHVPVFEYRSSEPDEDEAAMRLDKELQIYLAQYLTSPAIPDEDKSWPSDQIDPDLGKATPEQLADFETKKADTKRDWNKVGKRTNNKEKEDDAEAASLYQTIAGAENITDETPMDDIPF
jgi:hypothetical protein